MEGGGSLGVGSGVALTGGYGSPHTRDSLFTLPSSSSSFFPRVRVCQRQQQQQQSGSEHSFRLHPPRASFRRTRPERVATPTSRGGAFFFSGVL